VDVYTCGDPSKAYKAMDYIISVLQPTRVDKQVFDRGILEQSEELEFRSTLLKV